ncbi:alkyl hydroperoxide reductase AhpD [Lentzea sp. NBRC 105346]|uniref:carboxymuconolactone decarboxylase family protein n=1 Tax=Lentzea sp. NBRC 105346 TaxID=3032205 RepID=UPI0024A1E44C|nr:carboxymuconolactone decarboxylase family protein [Lentzea sp. NBRC 105346]GLZ31849.1 alkyl hydroperoxide reductase AhpD [Lentzea sp. NBRC 105346]
MSYEALLALHQAVGGDTALDELVRLRCSQLNGCTYCIRLHSSAARQTGEPAERIDDLPWFRTSPHYTDAERSALALAEAVTMVHSGRVSDEVLEAATEHHGQEKVTQLIWVAIVTNAFNRLAISTRVR